MRGETVDLAKRVNKTDGPRDISDRGQKRGDKTDE